MNANEIIEKGFTLSKSDFRNKRMQFKVTNSRSRYYTEYFATLDEAKAFVLTQEKHGESSAHLAVFNRAGVKVW